GVCEREAPPAVVFCTAHDDALLDAVVELIGDAQG
ncbi:hypothetical protein PSYMO_37167, partial [Pseudomonas amygdali pv. mori str. 301020]